jgi:competence protein ComEA
MPVALCSLLSSAFAQKLPDGPGKETFASVCSLCHSPAGPMGKQWTKPQWEDKVREMLQEEPDVTAAERAAIVEYLAANFKPGGKIYINEISGKDLAALLGIASDSADVIAKYRDAHGRFKTVDDVKGVPGVDDATAARLVAAKDRLEY